jgi:N-acetylmuramate 1-kinase
VNRALFQTRLYTSATVACGHRVTLSGGLKQGSIHLNSKPYSQFVYYIIYCLFWVYQRPWAMVAHLTTDTPKAFTEFITKNLKIENFSVLPLAGDASSRRYYRVVKNNQSWVLMEWDAFQNPENFPFISIQKHLHVHQINVPEIIAFDEKQGLFLLEDLGDLTLERRFWEFLKQDKVLPFYQVTLDFLVKLHKLYLDPKNRHLCTAYQVQFDVEKFTWELNYTFKNLFTQLCPHQLSETQVAELQNEFSSLARTLAEAPQVLCHRDFHSRNIMIKGDKIYFIDFQDARLGPPQYDLVSLVHDSYVKLNPENIKSLIQYYLKHFPEVLTLYKNETEFMKYFHLQTLQRCFKASGTFAAILNQRNDGRYLKYLPHTIDKVRQALQHTPQFKNIKLLVDQLKLPQVEKWP